MKNEMLTLTPEWDKTFPQSDKVDHKKVTFHNRYGITLAADMYIPKNAEGKLPAIAVSGPFGAVKEQCSGLYAQTLAERGFINSRNIAVFGIMHPMGVLDTNKVKLIDGNYNRLEMDDEFAKLVRMIFDMFLHQNMI